jgi:RHS repeat-associated protein
LNQLTEDNSCLDNYNADGNMTEKISKTTGDTTHFEWDIENKLVEVRMPGMTAKYIYDALGRRMSKEVNGVVTKFRYDGQNLIMEMNAEDSITASYIFGPGIDNALSMSRNRKNYYYLKDGLNSVTALADSTSSVVKEYKYSAFGEVVEETGDSSLWNQLMYTSREWEKEWGAYFYRARYYDPQAGRFLNEDPIEFMAGDVNFYRYVFNSPVAFVDPNGTDLGLVSGAIVFSVTVAAVYPIAKAAIWNTINMIKNYEQTIARNKERQQQLANNPMEFITTPEGAKLQNDYEKDLSNLRNDAVKWGQSMPNSMSGDYPLEPADLPGEAAKNGIQACP